MSDHEHYADDQEATEDYPQEEAQEEEVEQEVEVEVEQVEGSKAAPPPAVTYDVESWRGLARPAAAEFLGSALFIFIACGSAMTTTNYKNVGSTNIGIALTFGFTIATLCWTIGHISGAHLNFAVTFAFTMLGRISLKRCFMYFMGQFLGGLIGIAFLKLVTPAQWGSNCFAANLINGDLTVGHAFVTEFILTFMLMFVVMAATDPAKVHQTLVPIAIGMAVFIAHMIAIPITGTSINPTRSFASAAAASNVCSSNPWSDHWVFWLAPISGATLAAFVYEMVFTAGGGKVGDLMDQYKRKKAFRAE